ncbi:MAG: heme-binding protein [Bacteroidetes bacterium]|nr:heme-binding protein [Bacteroidota bacterium]
MKTIALIALLLLVLFIASQIWANSQVKNIEEYPYTILKSFGDFEIREYAQANFIYVTMDTKTYNEGSGQGFNVLAGYIFGGNDRGQKIAMTSPVVMNMEEQMTMKFLVPAQYKIEDLPKPDNVNVQFQTEEERVMAAITFDGFANDEKIASERDKLFARLAEESIEHTGDWSFMGYDPPFKLTGRKNEVVVALRQAQ